MGSTVASAVTEMLAPQIIRVAVDQVIGSAGTEGLSLFVPEMLAAAGVGVRKARGHEKRPCGAGAGWGLGATGEVTWAQKWYIRDCP